MPADISQQVERLVHSGRFEEARCAAQRMTLENPADPHGWLLLGSVLMALGRPVIAAEPLRKARMLAPGNRSIIDRLYQTLIQAGLRLESLSQHADAEAMYQEAVEIAPDAITARLNLGRLLAAAGRYEGARQQFYTTLARHPDQPDTCAALALSYEFEGDYAQAIKVLQGALQHPPIAPPIALAYAVIARHVGEESSAISLLEELLLAPMPESVARDCHFALGKLYDAAGDYDRAFEHYRHGNRLLDYNYNPDKTRTMFRAIAEAFSVEHYPKLPRSGNESTLPVFIVGMPRSGTSLVEQILASHPQVFGAGERDDIARIVHALGGPAPTQEGIERLTGSDLAQAAQGYLDVLSRLSPEASRITDKMPHNFLALGYIDLLFPGCRVIHCVRDPRDTCLSIWFQQMTGNHPYTNDLDSLADYYRQYQVLMGHWKSVVRVPLLEMRYENLVYDIEKCAHDLVDFCGLAWNEQCLRFHENPRVVSTPTYNDVRKPVHDKSVGRWRYYERHLGLLAELVEKEV